MDNNTLQHYGVLGMKWGIRRARKNRDKASEYRKRGEKETAERYEKKAARIEQKHRNRAGSDKVYDSIKSSSTKKLIGQSFVMGTYGTLNYHRLRSKDVKRGYAFVASLASNLVSTSSGVVGIVEPRITAEYRKYRRNPGGYKPPFLS